MKVLAVHRQEEVLHEIDQKLSSAGWFVRSMTSGSDALLSTRLEKYDLIFCGLNLPVVSGIELVRSVRGLSANRTTPVVMLSEGEESDQQRELIDRLDGNWLTLDEVSAMKDLSF